jgi:hypothetical protein
MSKTIPMIMTGSMISLMKKKAKEKITKSNLENSESLIRTEITSFRKIQITLTRTEISRRT